MKKLMLIVPYGIFKLPFDYVRTSQHIGCAYLAAIAKDEDYEVAFIDAFAEGYNQIINKENDYYHIGLTLEQIAQRVEDFQPDVIGITLTSTARSISGIEISLHIKKLFPEKLIVFGGEHATYTAKELLRVSKADLVVLGEGEVTFRYVLRKIKENGDFRGITGTVWKEKNGEIHGLFKRPNNISVNDIPNPDYTIYNRNLYKKEKGYYTLTGNGEFPTVWLQSRGCYSACEYCSSVTLWGRKARWMNLERIRKQLGEIRNLGYDEIELEDDNILIFPAKAKEIFKIINILGFNWNLTGGIDPNLLTKEMIRTIGDSNCARVNYAIETYSLNRLKKYGKISKLKEQEWFDKIKLDIELFKKLGVKVLANFMIGFPDETLEDMYNTIEIAKKLKLSGLDLAVFYIVTPFPGTLLYKKVKEKGYLDKDKHYYDYVFTRGVISTEEFSSEQVTQLALFAYREANGEMLYKERINNHHQVFNESMEDNHASIRRKNERFVQESITR